MLKKNLFNPWFSQKLLIIGYVVFLLLIFSFLYYSYQKDIVSFKDKIIAEDAYVQKNLSSQLQTEITNTLGDVGFFARFFSRRLKELYAGNESRLENFDDSSVYSEFISYLAFRRVFSRIRLIDRDGLQQMDVTFADALPRLSLDKKPLFDNETLIFRETALMSEGQISLTLINHTAGKELLIAQPVVDYKGLFAGAVVVNYPVSRLGSRLQIETGGPRARLILMESDGQLLFDNSAQLPDNAKSFSDDHPQAWLKILAAPWGAEFGREGYFNWRTLIPQAYADNIVSSMKWFSVLHRDHRYLEDYADSRHKTYLFAGFVFFVFFTSSLYIINFYRDREVKEAESRQILQEARIFTAKLLEGALSQSSLEQEMHTAIERILSLSWLAVMSKGSIFIADDNGDLIMVAEKGLAKPLLTSCAVIRPGQCLCGRAASTRKIVFKSCLDHEHEITFEGITEHGHICVPIMKAERVLGVLNLYVEHGQKMESIHEDVLNNIAAALATVIENKSTQEELLAAHHEITRQHEQLEYERSLVEDTLLRIRSSELFDAKNIRYLQASVDKTAGDILLSGASSDDCRHYYLLGDFTGHGLSSALSGPTVADIFYAMSRKGFDSIDILETINRKLFKTLPVHLYLAACMVECDGKSRSFRIWNAGLPAAMLFRDNVFFRHFESRFLPLGIVDDLDFSSGSSVIQAETGDRLYVYSDGITEAPNMYEEMYGEERFIKLLSKILASESSLDDVLEDVREFTRHTPQADDITLLEIRSA